MSKMKNACLRHGCIKCCLETEMSLSALDVSRIERLGFSRSSFVINRDGSHQLRNVSRRCVFHDGEGCTIYGNRPEGCQLYPVVLNEDTGEAVLDSYCPHHVEFRLTQSASRKLVRLIGMLDMERTAQPRGQANAESRSV